MTAAASVCRSSKQRDRRLVALANEEPLCRAADGGTCHRTDKPSLRALFP
jgi:hypothetical protein